jgi:serine/threonine-protein kinase
MAEVFLACTEDGGKRQFFALKLVLPHLRDEPGFEKMLLREAAIAARLEHPNIVKVVDFSESDHYIAMEFVDGKPLRDIMRRATDHGPPPLQVSLSIIHALACALHAAHEAVDEWDDPLGLVHRDVTPSNVLVTYDGTVKLADFGIAKATTRVHTTIGGAMKGKIGYMSPEQCRCEPLDRRSDLFSLGVLLYELTVGQRLFPALNEFGIMGRLLRGQFPRPRDVRPDFPTELDAIINKATSVEPDLRFQTAKELALALETFAEDFGFALEDDAIRNAMDSMYPPIDRLNVDWVAAEILDGVGDELETWEWSGDGIPEEEEFFSVTEPIVVMSDQPPAAFTGSHPAVPIEPSTRPMAAAIAGACFAAFTLLGGAWIATKGGVATPEEPVMVRSAMLPLRAETDDEPEQPPVTEASRPSVPRPPTPQPQADESEADDEVIVVEDDRTPVAAAKPRPRAEKARAPARNATKHKRSVKKAKPRKRKKKRGWSDSLDTIRPFRGGK